LGVDISILVIGGASDIKGYDRRRPELSGAPLHMKQDTASIEQYTLKLRFKLRFRL